MVCNIRTLDAHATNHTATRPLQMPYPYFDEFTNPRLTGSCLLPRSSHAAQIQTLHGPTSGLWAQIALFLPGISVRSHSLIGQRPNLHRRALQHTLRRGDAKTADMSLTDPSQNSCSVLEPQSISSAKSIDRTTFPEKEATWVKPRAASGAIPSFE